MNLHFHYSPYKLIKTKGEKSSSTFDFMCAVSLWVWLCMSQRYQRVALIVVPMMLSTSQPPDKKAGSSEQMNGLMLVG